MIKIFADFDRDGRVSTQPAEYALRNQSPGAIIQPNLDIDGRSLPSSVSQSSGSLIFDHQRTIKSGSDNDLLPIRIVIATPLPANARVEMTLSSTNNIGDTCRLYDNNARIIQPLPDAASKTFPLTLNSRGTDTVYKLESIAYGSLPFSLQSQGLTSNMITITVNVLDTTNNNIGTDSAIVSISPLILVGDTAPIERLYMAELTQNTPSVRDVQNVMSNLSIPLVLVPPSVNNGDTWIQDQFQFAFSHTPSGVQKTILHLPRLRSDSRPTPNRNNLTSFVNDHFPSRNLGIVKDFWLRFIRVTDAQGREINIPFLETSEINEKISLLYRLKREVEWAMSISAINRNVTDINRFFGNMVKKIRGYFKLRTQLAWIKSVAHSAYALLISDSTDTNRQQFLRNKQRALNIAITNYETLVPIGNVGGVMTVILSTATISAIELLEQYCDLLERRISSLHSSHNYGGNIEVSPSLPNHPFGKIIIGSQGNGYIPVDFNLLEFLREQNLQPLVEINTTWLDVGHVDEVLTCVPSNGFGLSDFAILRASPAIGLKILNEAADLFWSGLNPLYRSTFYPSSTYYERKTGKNLHLGPNPHPITHMLRGKFWLHKHEDTPNAIPLEPPWIYRSFAENVSGSIVMHWQVPYTPGPGADRIYPAHINVLEFLHYENTTNQCIEDVLLAERPTTPGSTIQTADSTSPNEEDTPNFDNCGVGSDLERDEKAALIEFLNDNRLDTILKDNFPNVPVIGLPVLFDRMDDWSNGTTIAFLPDLVNLQILGNHVLVPRPYGPRMSVNDTITILTKVMSTLDASILRPLTARYIDNKRLNQTWHWQDGGVDDAQRVSAEDIAKMFQDGFSESLDEVERLIVNHHRNRGVFDSNKNVRRGWNKIFIPENNVDLFEAYTQLVLESLGLTIHWVDSWYYHTHAGGIHCGTNAIRNIIPLTRTQWWSHFI